MSGKKVKGQLKAKVTTTKGKAVKPKMGRGTAGVIPVSLKMKVEKDRKAKEDKNG